MMEKSSLPTQPEPVPWTLTDLLLGLGMVLGLVISIFLVAEMLSWGGLLIDSSILVATATASLAIPAWYFSVHKYGLSWAVLGLRAAPPRVVAIGFALMFGSFVFNFLYGSLLAQFDLQIQPGLDTIFDNTAYPLLILFAAAIIAPITEEILFRGFLFPGLRKYMSWQWAAVISAMLFAVAHSIPTTFPPVFIWGLIFAYLYQLSGSIWPSVLMHMLNNTLTGLAVYALSQGWIDVPQGWLFLGW